ncbi:MAG: helix-turn-helix transcriptional regulator [Planctomycetota bacterium]|nr:helix-turn-helix transcriptional regulator [Planctomycetota bacterium]
MAVSPRKSGRSLLTQAEWVEVSGALKLSDRETEIVQCVFDDMKERAIATHLGISAHTVHTHLERLYRKLTVSSRCGLVLTVVGEYHRLSGIRQPEPARV